MFSQPFIVRLLNFRPRDKLPWKRGKGTELGLHRGLGLIISCFSTYSPFEVSEWGMVNLEVCVRVSPGVVHT